MDSKDYRYFFVACNEESKAHGLFDLTTHGLSNKHYVKFDEDGPCPTFSNDYVDEQSKAHGFFDLTTHELSSKHDVKFDEDGSCSNFSTDYVD